MWFHKHPQTIVTRVWAWVESVGKASVAIFRGYNIAMILYLIIDFDFDLGLIFNTCTCQLLEHHCKLIICMGNWILKYIYIIMLADKSWCYLTHIAPLWIVMTPFGGEHITSIYILEVNVTTNTTTLPHWWYS